MAGNNGLDWNIQLDFGGAQAEAPAPAATLAPKLSAREVLRQQAPHLLEQIDMLWCTRELNRLLEELLFEDAHGQLTPEVIAALGETHREHRRALLVNGLAFRDVWDMQFGDGLAGKTKQAR
jgi:hypothetical protein